MRHVSEKPYKKDFVPRSHLRKTLCGFSRPQTLLCGLLAKKNQLGEQDLARETPLKRSNFIKTKPRRLTK